MSRSFRILSLAVMLAGLLVGIGSAPQSVAAAGIPDALPNTPTTVFFPQTGHAVGSAFLKYWQNNGAPRAFRLSSQRGDATSTRRRKDDGAVFRTGTLRVSPRKRGHGI